MDSATQSANYPHLAYSQAELADVMRRHYDDIIDFVTTPEFKELMAEMGNLSPVERPRFVVDVLLSDDELAMRGIVVPDDLLIQRSSFGDRRPTLFVVKKFLPAKYLNVWQNVNITFDNEFADEAVSRDPKACWRAPLPVHEQAIAMSEGIELEEI